MDLDLYMLLRQNQLLALQLGLLLLIGLDHQKKQNILDLLLRLDLLLVIDL